MQLPSDNRFSTTVERFHELLDTEWGREEVKAILSILAAEYLGWNRADMVLNKEKALSESELLKFHFALKELLRARPVQYIIGHTPFYGSSFRVDENVLIPRPETEELVDLICKTYQNTAAKILDIGTGSGCIAVSLAKHLPLAEVSAIDVSPGALQLARANAESNQVNIHWHELDILQADSNFFPAKQLDVIVSNPPYVLKDEASSMKRNVLEHEPHLALFVEDSDALLFYRRIVALAEHWLKQGGRLYFEINEQFAQEGISLFSELLWRNTQIHHDLQGKDRMLSAEKI
ncbi:MAG TPA: peptide chain release factor N(5)-glutamine methyltransferase [Flavobacteriales bacterium]|nr:peptide chain release factor N(5)-glutamine methyltransferase [Flavobacteriales bacterium]HCA82145.1 peptide chain release factor N(5)-glutamine methyltransferase [Flavobacteriales bacterium]HRE75483.1 peptide chain release factor N(5)-glutamine methyltransferase [Flavobacteriales bacterium]HRE98410.1 peptide chain release factor N(5)-glutamine methyltransferase [Flavobacteriales bacterium]HRJ35189.1 peptide chain release factor N(5)-glutamine methyltransferase [Flavobacteriales bacterium]